MSKKKGHSTPMALSLVRYFVGFTGRAIVNFFHNLSWVFRNGRNAHDSLESWYLGQFGSQLDPWIKWLVIAIILILAWKYVLAIVILWALLRAI